MATGLYNQLGETWKNQDVKRTRELTLKWRGENSVIKVERPTRLDKARMLGYKAKKGFVIARVRVPRGGKKRPMIVKGRRSRNFGQRLVMGRSYQWIAEQRANKVFPNLEVLNSYKSGRDGLHYWFEVILVDPAHPVIKADPHMKWISSKKHTGRVYRGLTSAGRKSRGLLNKGKGAEKLRPSLGAHLRTGK